MSNPFESFLTTSTSVADEPVVSTEDVSTEDVSEVQPVADQPVAVQPVVDNVKPDSAKKPRKPREPKATFETELSKEEKIFLVGKFQEYPTDAALTVAFNGSHTKQISEAQVVSVLRGIRNELKRTVKKAADPVAVEKCEKILVMLTRVAQKKSKTNFVSDLMGVDFAQFNN